MINNNLIIMHEFEKSSENQIITTINFLHPEHVFLALTFLKVKD